MTDSDGTEKVVGCLSIEISRFANYLLDRGATVTGILTSTHHRRSFLIEGGLEIISEVIAQMIETKRNKHIISYYLKLVNESYKETPSERQLKFIFFSQIFKSLIQATLISPGKKKNLRRARKKKR